ncbi:glutamate formimidoyltransferase [Compostibacter hankyongensis]|uniref:glutamate formimidoyltransferase n=1 Tax=Compostibacter hankyongensis TaxID=1007089 RepID=A0ABP8G6E8_9BACT
MPDNRLIECVPNFSEGSDPAVIRAITDAVGGIPGVQLLHTDIGKTANRMVVTFAGPPDAVAEAAFRAIRKACELIDMSRHQGVHPRIGAVDVCPLIPISGISMEETAGYARALARRVGEELQVPVYLYGKAALMALRTELSDIRRGQYEGLAEKLKAPEWLPDFGPAVFHAKAGAVVIGARDFLVAYNVNLDTADLKIARAIAADIREKAPAVLSGRAAEEKNARRLPAVKAIGWYMEEYGIAQVSMNLTDARQTPVHTAFEACVRRAADYGVRVSGSELVGMIPLRYLTEAGRFFLEKKGAAGTADEEVLVRTAVKALGLDDLRAFDPRQKVIEYVMQR